MDSPSAGEATLYFIKKCLVWLQNNGEVEAEILNHAKQASLTSLFFSLFVPLQW
jgi:hypothetical protein